MNRLRVLAFAVATGRIGHVLVIGERLMDWGLSKRASRNTDLAAMHAHRLINELKPDVVVTERVPKYSTKGLKTRALIESIAAIAAKAKLLDIQVVRLHDFPNKYVEAQYLATKHPEIAQWVPKPRRLWEPEPRETVLFEALSTVASLDERQKELFLRRQVSSP
jgi:hypothetical protein